MKFKFKFKVNKNITRTDKGDHKCYLLHTEQKSFCFCFVFFTKKALLVSA